MNEAIILGCALILSVGVVWFIHWIVMRDVNLENGEKRVFFCLEVVVVAAIVGAFLLGEVGGILDRFRAEGPPGQHVGVTVGDAETLLGSFGASLLIYWIYSKISRAR
jgi:hypothetical protein